MKKYYPYRAGFIVIYVLGLLCIGDAVFSLISQLSGTANPYMSSFSMFSYLIAILAFFYVKMYIVTRVELDGKKMRIVFPCYIKPAPGAKRAMFIYRQGETDIKLVDKTFPLAELQRYGYIEDLGYAKLDQSNAGPKNKLFPVHEIALVMQDGRRYHMNGAFYSEKQLQGMLAQIYEATRLAPEGSLRELAPQAARAAAQPQPQSEAKE